MEISSSAHTRPRPKLDSGSNSPTKEKKAKKSASDVIDEIKSRSTLVGLVEPLGVTVGFLSQPMLNLGTLGDGASALFQGDWGGVGDSVNTIVDRAYNPHGLGGKIYNSGLAISALSGAAVGGLEVYAGIKSENKYLVMMGAADLVGSTSHVATMMDFNGPAMGLSVAANVARTALVLTKPEEYSRTQKVKTILDSGGAVASSMLKNGFLVGPALGVSAVAGIGQMAYMNHEGFRTKVDSLIDKVFKKKKGIAEMTLPQGPTESGDADRTKASAN